MVENFLTRSVLSDRSNKTLYDDVSLVPLPVDYQPVVEQLPDTRTGTSEGTKSQLLFGLAYISQQ